MVKYKKYQQSLEEVSNKSSSNKKKKKRLKSQDILINYHKSVELERFNRVKPMNYFLI